MDDKRQDFLWIVQTILLSRTSAVVGISGLAGDAVAASYPIPATTTARDAALQFCSCMVEGYAGDEAATVPHWMAALSDPGIR